MSIVEKPTSVESSDLRGSDNPSAARQPGRDRTESGRVYEELGRLAEVLPERFREVFCFRWGLHGHFPHVGMQVARKFEIGRGTVDHMLNRCLWNVARHAHGRELSAIRELLGEDRERWAERAWAHAERRWGNQDSEFSQTVLVLSVGGLDVHEAHQVARQYMVDIGLGRGNRWGECMTASERADVSRQGVDRMLAQVIWPSHAARLSGLEGFSVQLPLPAWAPAKSGVFHSDKLGRLVQFDSELELLILRQLDADPRVVEYQEQPVTIPYVLDGEAREYTPDVIVHLDDGRAFIIEAKPLVHLGHFMNWMKWASLARWCERSGFWLLDRQSATLDHRTSVRAARRRRTRARGG